MILLAIDTAARSCSVGVVSDRRVLAEQHRADGRTHSRHVMALVDSILGKCRLQLSDLDALAVTVGPGSFTGLRIGLATAKGLAYSAALPLVGVSTLAALCQQASGEPPLVCPLIDARKGEVYGGIFRCSGAGPPQMEGDIFVSAPEAAAGRIVEPCRFLGDGALLYRERIRRRLGDRARFAPDRDHRIRAATVGRIGLQQLADGWEGAADDAVPLYVRKSDAERKLGAGAGFC